MIKRAARRAAAAAGDGLDRLFVRAAFQSRRASSRARNETSVEQLDEIGAFYRKLDREGLLFPDPPRIEPKRIHVRQLPDGRVVDLSWPSPFEAHHRRYRPYLEDVPRNATVHVRWFHHRVSRPTLVCIHGWGSGPFRLEERAFRAAWLYRAGYDLALFTLPFHARRSRPGFHMPRFPSPDPMRTNEGFAQAIGDLRSLIRWLREEGAPQVGVCGMSLGGNTAALLATVESNLDFAVPIIPVASIPELMWRLGGGSEAHRAAVDTGLELDRFRGAFAATSPLQRAPLIDSERVLIIAGKRDRVIPMDHPDSLRDHFGAREVVTFQGSHLVQVGMSGAFRVVLEFLEELGIRP